MHRRPLYRLNTYQREAIGLFRLSVGSVLKVYHITEDTLLCVNGRRLQRVTDYCLRNILIA